MNKDEHEADRLALAVEAYDAQLKEAWKNLRTTPALQLGELAHSVAHIATNATRKVRSDIQHSAHDAVVDHAVVILAGAFAVGVLIGLSRSCSLSPSPSQPGEKSMQNGSATLTDTDNGHGLDDLANSPKVAQAKESLEAVSKKVKVFVDEHPVVAVAGAVAAGFVVGRLLSRM